MRKRRKIRVTGAAALAVLLPVAAVWLHGLLPDSVSTAGAEDAPSAEVEALTSAEVPGFRSDAWLLPDEEDLGFVEIPAGPFAMGSDPRRDRLTYDVEVWPGPRPQGSVDLPSYYIGRLEVTVAQFAAFVEATGHAVDEETLQGPPDHPVTSVSWPDALAYTRWLDAEMRKSPQTPPRLRQLLEDGWRVGLPSEAEWEKAARGTDGRIYPWGDTPRADRANFRQRATRPVGSFECPECAHGLSDMSGNVWEWTRSPYQPYPYDESDDRDDLEEDALWVMRGGSFADDERNIRAATRGGADPGARRPFIGFRLVISRF